LNENLLEAVIANPPKVHQGDTEVSSDKALVGSSLTGYMRELVEKNLAVCHGIDPAVARFLYAAVTEDAQTLETGSGLSTLIFAMRKAYHTVVTPRSREAAVIREYAREKQIDIDRVEFVLEGSETFLPRCTLQDLDLVLIDGKHSVPWPFIDWFYTADKLKVGGVCVIDDIHLQSVLTLVNFLKEEPRWELVWELKRRTMAFRKLFASVRDVAWHQQPYVFRRYGRKARILSVLGIKWRPKPKE
jgi:predicted O-methyltransferase YrrM